jgi:hypothetical protein
MLYIDSDIRGKVFADQYKQSNEMLMGLIKIVREKHHPAASEYHAVFDVTEVASLEVPKIQVHNARL